SEWLVEHGDEAWRSRHPEVVVAVAGLEGLRSAASPETKSARHIRTEEELLPEVVDKPHGQSTEAQRTPPVDTVKVTPSETPVQTPAVPAADVMSVLSPTSGRIRNDLSPGNLPAAAPQRLDPVSHAQLVLHWSQPAERGWTRLLTIPGLLGIAL